MTDVEFHTGVADPVAFACRLLRKAALQGVRVQVTAPPDRIAELDRSLWTFEEREFVPHARLPGAAAVVVQRTPILLSVQPLGADAPRVLVNLGAGAPSSLDELDRVIEIVSTDADEAARARERWRNYKALGLPLKHHQVTGA